MNSYRIPRLLFFLVIACSGCSRSELHVKRITEPEYPLQARVQNIEGTVEVGVQIGIDGRALWVHGTGANPVLVGAAERNARQWVWGPFPPSFEFPFYHEIFYTYKLEGKPAAVIVDPPTVRTNLPDRIEIIARPYKSDLDELVPEKPDVEGGPRSLSPDVRLRQRARSRTSATGNRQIR